MWQFLLKWKWRMSNNRLENNLLRWPEPYDLPNKPFLFLNLVLRTLNFYFANCIRAALELTCDFQRRLFMLHPWNNSRIWVQCQQPRASDTELEKRFLRPIRQFPGLPRLRLRTLSFKTKPDFSLVGQNPRHSTGHPQNQFIL